MGVRSQSASGTGPCAPFASLYSSSKGNIISHIGGKLYGLYDAERRLCAGGRIPGAVKMATIWLIPKDAEKPADRRFKNTKK